MEPTPNQSIPPRKDVPGQGTMRFDPRTHAHRTDPSTSKDAAAKAQGFAPILAAQVFAELECGPGTGHELAARLGWDYTKVARRLTDLSHAERIRRTGAKRGGACEWEVTP